jgi:hypothetical protein
LLLFSLSILFCFFEHRLYSEPLEKLLHLFFFFCLFRLFLCTIQYCIVSYSAVVNLFFNCNSHYYYFLALTRLKLLFSKTSKFNHNSHFCSESFALFYYPSIPLAVLLSNFSFLFLHFPYSSIPSTKAVFFYSFSISH